MLIEDVVRNPEGELLAVTRGANGDTNYYKTAQNGEELDDEWLRYFFKRKSDIRKIRSSKEKARLIDKLNLWLLKNVIGEMGSAIELADEQLFHLMRDKGYQIYGDRWHNNVPSSEPLRRVAEQLSRGRDAYKGFLDIAFPNGCGGYEIHLERIPERWEAIQAFQNKT